MTTISAKIIADSISPDDIRLTTLQLRYPRFIHAEFMTHRVFSRNASSSRAIPVSRLIQDVLDDPAVPMFWGKNQKGMQAGEEHDAQVMTPVCAKSGALPAVKGVFSEAVLSRETAWLTARDRAVEIARAFDEAGYHKQIVNRLLEPFSHINVVVTATEWSNFFGLRRHKDAEPHIHLLADRMWEAMQASTPRLLEPGQWHLPYVSDDELDPEGAVRFTDFPEETGIKLSVARCARVSYLTHEGTKPTIAQDLALYEQLVGSQPLHASPAEHQATPGNDSALWGNFRGWKQYRKTLPGENIT